MNYWFFLYLVAGGTLFYRIGQHEYGAGFTCAGLSLILSLVTCLGFGWGLLGWAAGQLVLFAGLTWYNIRRNETRGPR